MIRYVYLFIIGFLILLQPGCSKKNSIESNPIRPVPVVLSQASIRSLQKSFTTPGWIQSIYDSDLSFETHGPLVWIIDEGQNVKKNDVIARLDTDSIDNQVELAQTQIQILQIELAQTQRDFDRIQNLVQSGVTPHEEFEKMETQLEKIKAQLHVAQLTLKEKQIQQSQHQLKSPFDGIIYQRMVSPGEFITMGKPVVSMINNQFLKIRFWINESNLRWIDPSIEAQVLIPSIDQSLQIPIERIIPKISDQTHNQTFLLTIQNTSNLIHAGMSCSVTLFSKSKSCLSIPNICIHQSPEGPYCFQVNEDHSVSLKMVETGFSNHEFVEILSGLDENALVVTQGSESIREGTHVIFES